MKSVKSIIKNPYFFSILTKIMLVAVGLLSSVITARYLGAELKGTVTHINSVTSIGMILLSFGVHQAYPYYKKNNLNDFKEVKDTYITAVLILLTFYVLLATIIICFVTKDIITRCIVLLLPLMTYTRIISFIVLVDMPNKKHFTEFIINLVDLIYLLCLFFFTTANLIWAVSLIIFKDLLCIIVFSIYFKIRLRFNKDTLLMLMRLFRFGFFPMISLLMSDLNYRVDVIMLAGNVAYSQIGIYSIGVSLAEKVWIFSDSMKEIMVSKLSEGKDVAEVTKVIGICNTISVGILLGLLILGKPVIDFLYGSEYNGAYSITTIVILGTISMNYYKMIASYNIVNNKQLVNFLFLTGSVLANIILNAITIPVYGIYGAAFSTIISYAICSASFIIYFCKKKKVSLKDMIFIKKADISFFKNKKG